MRCKKRMIIASLAAVMTLTACNSINEPAEQLDVIDDTIGVTIGTDTPMRIETGSDITEPSETNISESETNADPSAETVSESVSETEIIETTVSVAPRSSEIFDEKTSDLQRAAVLFDTCCKDMEMNTTISPLSLNMALGVIANGANDEVKADLENFIGHSVADYNDFAKAYMDNLPEHVSIANAVFVDDEYSLQDVFRSTVADFFKAEASTIDFDKAESAANTINNWCAKHTNDMIPKIIDAGSLANIDMAVLNAVYFKDSWKDIFTDDDIVKDQIFTDINNNEITVDLMRTCDKENIYYENDKATGFVKYYDNTRYGFVAMLPKETGDFNIADLDIDSFMASESREYDVISLFPAFSFENQFNLNSTLKALGLESIYVDGAFDNILENFTAHVDYVQQNTKIDVNREGTEASAITSIFMKADSCAIPEVRETKTITCDRPFAFMIYDFDQEQPLFIGKVVTIDKE